MGETFHAIDHLWRLVVVNMLERMVANMYGPCKTSTTLTMIRPDPSMNIYIYIYIYASLYQWSWQRAETRSMLANNHHATQNTHRAHSNWIKYNTSKIANEDNEVEHAIWNECAIRGKAIEVQKPTVLSVQHAMARTTLDSNVAKTRLPGVRHHGLRTFTTNK